jgi:hypothetical protein
MLSVKLSELVQEISTFLITTNQGLHIAPSLGLRHLRESLKEKDLGLRDFLF